MNYEEIAKKIGNIQGNEPVTAADVQAEMRSKGYVVQGGKLSPSELFRLSVYAKKRTIRRIVAEAFAADAVRARPVVARKPLAMARATDPLYDRETQARYKAAAWAGYRAGLVR